MNQIKFRCELLSKIVFLQNLKTYYKHLLRMEKL